MPRKCDQKQNSPDVCVFAVALSSCVYFKSRLYFDAKLFDEAAMREALASPKPFFVLQML